MLERVRQNVRRLVNQATPRRIHANPFGKALDKPDDIVDELTRNAIRLNPLITIGRSRTDWMFGRKSKTDKRRR